MLCFVLLSAACGSKIFDASDARTRTFDDRKSPEEDFPNEICLLIVIYRDDITLGLGVRLSEFLSFRCFICSRYDVNKIRALFTQFFFYVF